MLVEVIKFSKNIQVSRPLLELRSRHVVVHQVKVPQVALVKKLADSVASPSAFLPNIETSLVRSRGFLVTSSSNVAVGSCHTGGPFLLRRGAIREGLGRTKGVRPPSPKAGSRLSSRGSFFDAGRTQVGHLHHQRQRHDPDAQRVLHLSSQDCL